MYFRVTLIDQSPMMRRNLTILRKMRRLNNSETRVREKQTHDGSSQFVLSSKKGFNFSCSTELKMYSLMMTANGHIDPHGTVAPPIIMRTAATPMPTPKSSLGPESILGDDLMCRDGVTGEVGLGVTVTEAGISNAESRRGSSTSMEPIAYDQRSLVSHMM